MVRILAETLARPYTRDEILRAFPSYDEPPPSVISLPTAWRDLPQGDSVYRRVNQVALQQIPAWAPQLFPLGRPYQGNGWRVSSAALGRGLEEDLSITPQGIKDFGVHDQGDPRQGRRTPIGLVIEWGAAANVDDAIRWLCERIGIAPESLKPDPAGLPPYAVGYEQPEILSIEAATERLIAIVVDLLEHPLTPEGKLRRVVIRLPVGFGKTTRVVKLLDGKRVLWFAPTKKQGGEVHRLFLGSYLYVARQHVLGRLAIDPAGDGEQRMCWRHDEVEALKGKGLARYASRLLCHDKSLPQEVARCPHFWRCAYNEQARQPEPITVAAHEYLPLELSEVISKSVEAHGVDLAVIDESPLSALLERHHWTPAHLQEAGGVMARIVGELVQGRTLREIAADLDIEATMSELEAAIAELPRFELPPVLPGQPSEQNLAVIKRHKTNPSAQLATAYKAFLTAIQGAVNSIWYVPSHGGSERRRANPLHAPEASQCRSGHASAGPGRNG